MNPAAQLSVSLLVGLFLWLPTLSATMQGQTDLPESTFRYLAAFLLARLAVGGIARLIHVYSGEADEDVAPMVDEERELSEVGQP